MAHMTQKLKKELSPGIKEVLQKWGMKGTISVNNSCELRVTIRSGKLPFDSHETVNQYWIHKTYQGDKLNFLTELNKAINVGNFDNSDIMTDYFSVGWYTEICFHEYQCEDSAYQLSE